MVSSNGRTKRQRGEIETLPSGSLRVKVYAGVDPISGKRHYLTEVTERVKDLRPAGVMQPEVPALVC